MKTSREQKTPRPSQNQDENMSRQCVKPRIQEAWSKQQTANSSLTQNMMLNPKMKYLMQQLTSWALKCFPDIIWMDFLFFFFFFFSQTPPGKWKRITSMLLCMFDSLVVETPFFFFFLFFLYVKDSTNAPSIVSASNYKHHPVSPRRKGADEATEEPFSPPPSLWGYLSVLMQMIRGYSGEINPLKSNRFKPMVSYLTHNLDMAVILWLTWRGNQWGALVVRRGGTSSSRGSSHDHEIQHAKIFIIT